MSALLALAEISDAPCDGAGPREIAFEPDPLQLGLATSSVVTTTALRSTGLGQVCRSEAGPRPSCVFQEGQGFKQLLLAPALPFGSDHDAQPFARRPEAEQVEPLKALMQAPDASAEGLRLVAYAMC